ncbi:uncharacterized protein CDAR_73391 [Caerostris darwini]|uniref:Cyclin-dependent kinase inhibitor domain-containing protein n=1 Tax=Caerostris darwini TaxID=1538125 RepID=A0AAV4VKU2_9ARAC|nr:uncharacterized protein CDAR_73391 [Caerostris darwini]
MFTKRVQTLYHPDITTVNKMCQVLGLEPVSAQKVRRNLFGAGSGNVDEVLTNHMQEIADRSSRTWNFDFVREQPLNQGRYVWEKVCCDDTNCSKEDTTCEKENTLLVKVCDDSQVQPKCNNKSWLVQPSIRSYGKVQKSHMMSKRGSPYYLKRTTPRVTRYVVDDVGAS